MIKHNLEHIRQTIRSACEGAGTSPQEVRLIAVSKTKPLPKLLSAYDWGVRDFGENRVQELLEKKKNLPEDIRWHMIGHLQTNKVKQLVGHTALIHSIDSLRLADAIEAEAGKRNIQVEGLLEINVAKEASKFGFLPEDALAAAQRCQLYSHLKIRGLMTVAPYTLDPENNREVFAKLKQLAVDINFKTNDNTNMEYLSMGMTGDYGVAVQEGGGFTTFVRIGTGIFGVR